MSKPKPKGEPRQFFKKGRRAEKKVTFVEGRPIFERQPDETDKAWQAFIFYRDLGLTRTMYKAAAQYREFYGIKSKPISTERTLSSFSRKWGWRERVVEWERELDKQRQLAAIKAVQKMNSRHINLATSIQALAATELNKWIKKAQKEANKNETLLTVPDFLKAVEAGVKLERASRGEPEAIIEERHHLEVGEKRKGLIGMLKNPDDLDKLKELVGKLNAKSEGE